MAADVISAAGIPVTLFEKRPGPARKLFIAGSSGLNITYDAPLSEFTSFYRTEPQFWNRVLTAFGPNQWLQFLHELGLKTFLGTSGRYFVEEMNAARLVLLWRERLISRGAHFEMSAECVNFDVSLSEPGVTLHFAGRESQTFSAVGFGLGGGSYEPDEIPLRWPSMFINKQIGVHPFQASNVGYQVAWPQAFLQESEGRAIKNIRLTCPTKGSQQGDLMITAYGLEGTPIYFVGESGTVLIDLKPDLTHEQMMEKCSRSTENLSPIRRIKKYLNFDEPVLSLIFHLTDPPVRNDLSLLLERIKAFPIRLGDPQPIAEAISTAGGIELTELTPDFMFHKCPGVFAAGEMLNWDAPTGGFWIQGCVSQGHLAGLGILKFLKERR